MCSKRTLAIVLLLGGGLAVASPDPSAAPAGAPGWLMTLAPATPYGRAEHAMAYDSARGRVVLFGGYRGSSFVKLADTWEWDGSVWAERATTTKPSARSGHAMVYDSARERVVLFGGYDGSLELADTWEWDGGTWVERTPATSPPFCSGNSMAYDSARGRTVLFTACSGSSPGPGTWEWDGTD
jgi:galactose oxidase-like protein